MCQQIWKIQQWQQDWKRSVVPVYVFQSLFSVTVKCVPQSLDRTEAILCKYLQDFSFSFPFFFFFFFQLWQIVCSKLTVNVEQLLGFQGPWWCQVCRVQGHRLTRPQELWPYQSLFLSFLQLALRRPLWPVCLPRSTHSGTQKASLPGILPCGSMCQHIERPSWLGSSSVDQCIRHLKEHGEWGSTLILCIRHLKEHPGWCPALYFTMFSICWASLTIVVTADASMWGERGYGDCSTHIHVTQ